MLFNHNFQIWGTHHTPSLIYSLWEFCQVAGITQLAPMGWAQFYLQRENDCFVMEAIEGTKLFSPEKLEHINQCWRHLEVFTLVDIAMGGWEEGPSMLFPGDLQ